MAPNNGSLAPLIFLTLLAVASSQVPDCNAEDRRALLKIKNDLRNPDSLMTWGGARSCCSSAWDGIECDDQNRVSDVSVIDVPHPLPIPPSIADVPRLRRLSIRDANLTGSIPRTLTKSRYLERLAVTRTTLSGNIPTFLCSIKTLESIDLSSNRLAGSIPDCFGNKVASLVLSSNRLAGRIPSRLPTSVTELDLSHNELSGGIPAEIAELKGLRVFDVSYNMLSGRIPSGGVMSRFNESSYVHNKRLCGPSFCVGS